MTDELKPAVYQKPEDREGDYKEHGLWKWVLGITVVVLGVIAFQRYISASRMSEIQFDLDAQLLELTPERERIDGFRHRLEELIVGVGIDVPDTYAKPGFELSSLHGQSGLYLRIHGDSIPAEGVERDLEIRDSALTMGPDAIGSCLGINPLSMRSVYERIEFLQPIWREHAMAAETVLELEVFADELARRKDRDLPILEEVVQSEYFMLTIQRGESRHDAPVDVYLWDLRDNTLLLSSRVQARGTFIRARSSYSEYGRSRPLERRAGVADCSIAATLREVAGRGAGEVSAVLPDATREPDLAPDTTGSGAGDEAAESEDDGDLPDDLAEEAASTEPVDAETATAE